MSYDRRVDGLVEPHDSWLICPNCSVRVEFVNCHTVCPRCHTIVESCSDGGRLPDVASGNWRSRR